MPLYRHYLRQQNPAADRIIVSAEYDAEGNLLDIVYAPFGYHSLVVNIHQGRATLCRVQRQEDPDFPEECSYALIELTPALSAEHMTQFHTWLMDNVEVTGGTLTLSGFYPVSLPLPEWLKKELRYATEV
jgi:hypothetical protein